MTLFKLAVDAQTKSYCYHLVLFSIRMQSHFYFVQYRRTENSHSDHKTSQIVIIPKHIQIRRLSQHDS